MHTVKLGSAHGEADFELHTQTMLKEVGDHFDTRRRSRGAWILRGHCDIDIVYMQLCTYLCICIYTYIYM